VNDLTLKVEKIVEATPAIKVFDLVAAEGATLPPFTAGAHVDVAVTLPDGSRDKRSYSLVNSPAEAGRYRLGILRDANSTGGSAFMHEGIREGDELAVSEPKNHFPLSESSGPSLLIAGGIGITPIFSMARVLLLQDREFELHYVARSPADMAFRADIEAELGERARLYFDGGDPARGADLEGLLEKRPEDCQLYVCGPAGLIGAVRDKAHEWGWPEAAIHYELFTAAEAKVTKTNDTAIEVTLAKSGTSHTVPAGESILEVLLDAKVEADFDCKMGICGLCATKVLAGEPDHRDHTLSADEQAEGQMCICISRAKTPELTLDL
jgi:vanillate O-demethylase ferredoxin subunit